MTTTNQQPASTALAKHQDPELSMAIGSLSFRGSLEPKTFDQAVTFAENMASIGYCGAKTAAEALSRVMTGRVLGLPATLAMRAVYDVNGRPGIDAAVMHAICLQHRDVCEYFRFIPSKSDATKATFVAKRAGDPEVEHQFTIDQAERMGVLTRETPEKTSDSNWTKSREAMLRARCRSELARILFPDLMFGMHSREELESGEDAPPPPHDPNEMLGEIVPPEQVTSTVQAVKRDYAKEGDAIVEKIKAAGTSRVELAAVREVIQKWDAVDPHKSKVTKAYNEAKIAQRAAAAPASGDAATAAPTGNLFTPEPAKP